MKYNISIIIISLIVLFGFIVNVISYLIGKYGELIMIDMLILGWIILIITIIVALFKSKKE